MPDSLSGWKPRKVSICQITILRKKLDKKMTFSKIFDIFLAWKLQYWISFLIQSPNCSQTFSSWWEGAATDVCKIFAHCKNSIICCCLFLEHCIIGVFYKYWRTKFIKPPSTTTKVHNNILLQTFVAKIVRMNLPGLKVLRMLVTTAR